MIEFSGSGSDFIKTLTRFVVPPGPKVENAKPKLEGNSRSAMNYFNCRKEQMLVYCALRFTLRVEIG